MDIDGFENRFAGFECAALRHIYSGGFPRYLSITRPRSNSGEGDGSNVPIEPDAIKEDIIEGPPAS